VLGALHFAFFVDSGIEPAKSIIKRVYEKGHYVNRSGIASELQYSDFISVLGCSERKAKEYIKLLQVLAM
jgi:hypothetical protein